MPYEQAHVYCCSDTLSFPLKGKVAARGRCLFIIWDLLDEQVQRLGVCSAHFRKDCSSVNDLVYESRIEMRCK